MYLVSKECFSHFFENDDIWAGFHPNICHPLCFILMLKFLASSLTLASHFETCIIKIKIFFQIKILINVTCANANTSLFDPFEHEALRK